MAISISSIYSPIPCRISRRGNAPVYLTSTAGQFERRLGGQEVAYHFGPREREFPSRYRDLESVSPGRATMNEIFNVFLLRVGAMSGHRYDVYRMREFPSFMSFHSSMHRELGQLSPCGMRARRPPVDKHYDVQPSQ